MRHLDSSILPYYNKQKWNPSALRVATDLGIGYSPDGTDLSARRGSQAPTLRLVLHCMRCVFGHLLKNPSVTIKGYFATQVNFPRPSLHSPELASPEVN